MMLYFFCTRCQILLQVVVVVVFVATLIAPGCLADGSKGDNEIHIVSGETNEPNYGHSLLQYLPKHANAASSYGDCLVNPQGYFLLNYTNFNHGSFGACPLPVLDYQAKLRWKQEQQPDLFLRQYYKQLWNDTRVRVAKSWNVPYQQLVLTESASTAVNSILRSLGWEHGVSEVEFKGLLFYTMMHPRLSVSFSSLRSQIIVFVCRTLFYTSVLRTAWSKIRRNG